MEMWANKSSIGEAVIISASFSMLSFAIQDCTLRLGWKEKVIYGLDSLIAERKILIRTINI
jgi:hypothetical protein